MSAPNILARTSPHRFLRSERGAAAVEFALIAPVLLALVFGIIDFGRAMFTYNVLTAAVREGARTAAVSGISTMTFDPAPAKARVADYINGAFGVTTFSSANVDVTYAAGTGLITVKFADAYAGYPFTPITPGFSRLSANNLKPKPAVFRWELATTP